MVNDLALRTIKSWIKRHPRLSPSQKNIIEKYHGSIHFDASCKQSLLEKLSEYKEKFSSIIFDIGFGLGHSLIHSATENPDFLVVGFDPHPNGSSHTLREIEKLGLDNVLIYQGDCNDLLRDTSSKITPDYIHIFFPDPWPKKRHHKRRLIQSHFLKILHENLNQNGIIHIATDWEHYAQHIDDVIDTNIFIKTQTRPEHKKTTRPKTKYEQRGLNLGHKIYEFYLEKQQVQ